MVALNPIITHFIIITYHSISPRLTEFLKDDRPFLIEFLHILFHRPAVVLCFFNIFHLFMKVLNLWLVLLHCLQFHLNVKKYNSFCIPYPACCLPEISQRVAQNLVSPCNDYCQWLTLLVTSLVWGWHQLKWPGTASVSHERSEGDTEAVEGDFSSATLKQGMWWFYHPVFI